MLAADARATIADLQVLAAALVRALDRSESGRTMGGVNESQPAGVERTQAAREGMDRELAGAREQVAAERLARAEDAILAEDSVDGAHNADAQTHWAAQVSAAKALVAVRRRTGRAIPDHVLQLARQG